MGSGILLLFPVWLGLNIAIVVIRLSVTTDRPSSAASDVIRFPPLSRYQASAENR